MARPQSSRTASKQATAAIAAMGKARVEKKFKLPKGTLKAQDANPNKRLVETVNAKDFERRLRFAKDPIHEFNQCMFFLSLRSTDGLRGPQ